jgi:hypothetical protein
LPHLALSTISPAGNGGSVRAMRLRGKAAWGIELSQAVLEQDAPDLLAAGLVEQGSLTHLPYQGELKRRGWNWLSLASKRRLRGNWQLLVQVTAVTGQPASQPTSKHACCSCSAAALTCTW